MSRFAPALAGNLRPYLPQPRHIWSPSSMSLDHTGNRFASSDLRLPDDLRGPLRAHLDDLRERYIARGWAGRVGFGQRPALIVIDLARFWTEPSRQIGANLDPVILAACDVLAAARAVNMPIFFTTFAF